MNSDDTINLLEIIENAVDANSIIIASQLPVASWYDYLSNKTVADAILDSRPWKTQQTPYLGTS